MRGPRAIVLTVIALVAVVASACTATSTGTQLDGMPTNTRLIDPKAAFTAKTLPEWKTLGDAIAIIDITDSQEDHTAQGDPSTNGGTYGRIATVSVDQILWQRDSAHTPPDRFTMHVWGWVEQGNVKQPIVARGEPRFEANHTYLVALARFSTGWAGLGSGAEVPFDNGTVGDGEWEGRDPSVDQPAIKALLGKNAAQVQQIVNATQPDPRSVQYGDLDPLARAKKLGYG